jgi:hypothetical protein
MKIPLKYQPFGISVSVLLLTYFLALTCLGSKSIDSSGGDLERLESQYKKVSAKLARIVKRLEKREVNHDAPSESDLKIAVHINKLWRRKADIALKATEAGLLEQNKDQILNFFKEDLWICDQTKIGYVKFCPEVITLNANSTGADQSEPIISSETSWILKLFFIKDNVEGWELVPPGQKLEGREKWGE